jgi:hypothetical protein
MKTQKSKYQGKAILNWLLSGIAGIVLCGQVQNVSAITVTDDFNRADGPLGANWTELSPYFQIISNQAHNGQFNGGVDGLTEYAGIDVGTNAFSVQANLSAPSADEWAGLAFNIQNSTQFYWARWRQDGYYQILGGSLFVQGTVAFAPDSLMTVTGDGVGNFTLTLAGSGPIAFNDTTYSGGGLGMYFAYTDTSLSNITFDNFSATYVVPEPSSLVLLALGGLLFVQRKVNRRTKEQV